MQAYCTLQLGYAYAGTAGSSVNEHWPRRAASTGAAYRTTFAPPDVEDVDAGGCGDLADAGACERSPEFMRAHCAATCAAEAAAARARRLRRRRERRRRRDGSVGFDAFHTQESCTTYNALKLNAELFGRRPHAALADAFERKLLNGVVGIARPADEHGPHLGEIIYMMPLGAGVSKEQANWAGFGSSDGAFWCCYGTAIESFAKLNDNLCDEAAAAAAVPELWVSQLFVPSEVQWAAGGATVKLQSSLAADRCDTLHVTIELAALSGGGACFGAGGCALSVRLLSWADGAASSVELHHDGSVERLAPDGDGATEVGRFVRIERTWAAGDSVRLRLGLYAYLEPLNDWRVRYAASYALVYGPLVMVALTQADEHSLKAAPTRVREWVNVEQVRAVVGRAAAQREGRRRQRLHDDPARRGGGRAVHGALVDRGVREGSTWCAWYV